MQLNKIRRRLIGLVMTMTLLLALPSISSAATTFYGRELSLGYMCSPALIIFILGSSLLVGSWFILTRMINRSSFAWQ